MNNQDDLKQYNHLTMTHPKQHAAFWLFMVGLFSVFYVTFVDVPLAIHAAVYSYLDVEE